MITNLILLSWFIIHVTKCRLWTNFLVFALVSSCRTIGMNEIAVHCKMEYYTGLESIITFFQGAQLHLQKLPKGDVYRNQYIFGLPAEIWGSHMRVQGSPGLPAPVNSEPATSHTPVNYKYLLWSYRINPLTLRVPPEVCLLLSYFWF